MPVPVSESAYLLDPLPTDLLGELRTEPVPPGPRRFVANVDAALGQQVLHVPHRPDHRRAVEIAERVGRFGHAETPGGAGLPSGRVWADRASRIHAPDALMSIRPGRLICLSGRTLVDAGLPFVAFCKIDVAQLTAQRFMGVARSSETDGANGSNPRCNQMSPSPASLTQADLVPIKVKLVSGSKDPRHVLLAERFSGAGLECEWTTDIDTNALASVNLICCNVAHGDALRMVRSVGGHRPIVLLCNEVDEVDRILALELGADDVFGIDQSPREMIARLRALARRAGLTQGRLEQYSSDGWILRPTMRSLTAPDGKSVVLTQTELQAVLLMIRAAGEVVTREQFVEQLNADRPVKTQTTSTLLCRLRKKLSRCGPSLIRTLRNDGYYLDCPVAVDMST